MLNKFPISICPCGVFVLVANGLHHMIAKCQDADLIKGLGCQDDTNAVVNLHYADDTLIFGEESSQAMKNGLGLQLTIIKMP